MSTTVTKSDVEAAASRVFILASEMGLLPRDEVGPPFLQLQEGSKTYGNAWRFYISYGPHGGVTGNVLGLTSGYLGWTKKEAFDTLQTIHGVLAAVKHKG